MHEAACRAMLRRKWVVVAGPGDDDARCDLTVVIPAFNEARRIEAPLRRMAAYLRAHHPASEVVLGRGQIDGPSGNGHSPVSCQIS